ncbi:MAG: endonuclease domain-containing protein [Endomicrobiales bacterium]|nr:endonuclease domain-containing protein [Endomicrobiales bacterium]
MKSNLRGLAKNFRKSSTKTENCLWFLIKNRQLEGVKFRRQEPLGRYIVDFVSYDKKLIIELDGGQHTFSSEQDKKRDVWFRKKGYEVLRFWDNEVLKNKNGVLEIIRKKLLTPHLTSPSRGEEQIAGNKSLISERK